ncbi:sensor histidine kinase, partial [Paracoccus sp. (in: a-proteobacteria)]|uniref:sensor histidine kinase n=1 Tax=Paracoccus sp. TaxID=267 RepID=UPI003A89546A
MTGRAAGHRLAGFLNGVPVAMLAVDGDARTLAANRPAEAMFGTGLTDRPFVTIMRHPAVVAALDWVLDPARNPAPAVDPALPAPPDGGARLRAVIRADGRDLMTEVTVAPMPRGSGHGALVAVLDHSLADEAEQTRRDFVANVSHELKTPLTALIGFVETLRGPARDDASARARFLDIMAREASRMNRLIQDLLSLSRVQAEERSRPLATV